MSIQLYVSNQLDGLFRQLRSGMQSRVPPVFQPYHIVSQTEGMNIWLKHQLAAGWGIASNIRFSRPNDILFVVYLALGGAFQVTLNRQSYVWMLYNILGTEEFKMRFPEQATYLLDTTHDTDIKRLLLAEKVADLFDQYQVYRQEFIEEWSAMSPDSAPHWQAYLWSKIEARHRQESSEYHNINYVRNYILQHIDDPEKHRRLREQLPVIYLFGLSVFTKYHLEVFYRLAKYIDICFYLINPSPFIYWGDDNSERDIALWKAKGYVINEHYTIGNELLVSWGKMIQQTIRLLFRNEELINAYEPVAVSEPSNTTLLSRVQFEIFHNMTLAERDTIPYDFLRDGTIQVHLHYTPQREVEGLYNYLVRLVTEEQPDIRARDILVVCSDVNIYAAFIEGVFSNAPVPFRYKIADTYVSEGDTLPGALLEILSLKEDSCTAEQVLGLLEFRAIREKTGIRDIGLVRSIVQEANIRSGWRGHTGDQTYTMSWWNGVRRMMYGICMSGEDLVATEDGSDFYPLDVVEGMASQDVILFSAFVTQLMKSVEQRYKARTVAEWLEYVRGVTAAFLQQDEEVMGEDMKYLHSLMNEYAEASRFFQEPLAYDIFQRSFVQQLSGDVRSGLFYNGGITFCSVVPMRSIPFKVVAMLGMDDDKFPRKEKRLNFNLMQDRHQLGDRNLKDSDKHLFLETVLSAQSRLYISYNARSPKDNTLKNPSVLINDLLVYLQQRVPAGVNVEEELCIQHPLHSFSARYNDPAFPGLYYYNKPAGTAVKRIAPVPAVREAPALPPELNLAVLVQFVSSPLKYFYRQVLGIRLEQSPDAIEDQEMFVFTGEDGLARFRLHHEIYQSVFEGKDKEGFLRQGQLKGLLPLKNVGAYYVDRYWTDMKQKLDTLIPEAGSDLNRTRWSVAVGGTILHTETLTLGRTMYRVVFSSNYDKHLVGCYLDAIAGRALDAIDTVCIVKYREKDEERSLARIDLSGIKPAAALDYLEAVLRYWLAGSEHPLEMDVLFYPYLTDTETGDVALSPGALDKEKVIRQVDDPYWNMYYRQTAQERDSAGWNSEAFYKDIILPLREFIAHKHDTE